MPRTARSQSPKDYFERVVSLIRRQALNSAEVDWERVRQAGLKMAEHAKTTPETYDAIRYVLSELNDGHSFLVPGRGGGGASSIRSEGANNEKRKREKAKTAALLGSIGYLPVPGVSVAQAKRYAENMRLKIAQFAAEGSNKWIFDLRGNDGGSMWPMLAGVGPILGAGIVGYFESPKLSVPWYYGDGVAGIETPRGRRKLCFVEDSIPDFGAEQPVAILINKATASSAEALAIAFKGRANTAYFGETTAGLSTCNDELRLPDGAKLYLTIAIDADRNRNLYARGLEPDFLLPQPVHSATESLQPAIDWLSSVSQSSGSI